MATDATVMDALQRYLTNALTDVLAERSKFADKMHHGGHAPKDFAALLAMKTGDVAQAATNYADIRPAAFRQSLVETAALALVAIDWCDKAPDGR